MNTSEKKIILAFAILLIIGAGLIMSPFGLIQTQSVDISTKSYTITFKDNPYGTENMDDYKNHMAIQGYPGWELTTHPVYITSWYGNGKSEPIHWEGKINFWTKKWCTLAGSGTINTIGYYGWKVFFTSSGGTGEIQIAGFNPTTGKGWWKSEYLHPDADWQRAVEGKPFDCQKFDGGRYATAGTFVSGNCGSGPRSSFHNDWLYLKPDDCVGITQPYTTKTVILNMLGPKVGKIRVELWVEWQPLKHGNICDIWSGGISWQKLQEDQFAVQSGRGKIQILPINSDSEENAMATDSSGNPIGVVYKKYHFEEGETVSIEYQTGLSGQTSMQTDDPTYSGDDTFNHEEDGWMLQIYKPSGATGPVYELKLNDNAYGVAKYKIPDNAFVKGGNNEWKVILTNGVIDQDELMLFVVDSKENLPGTPTITFYPNAEPKVGQETKVILEAGVNENTQTPIDYFRLTAKYGETGTDYVSGLNAKAMDAQKTITGTYKAEYSFTPTKTGDIYILAWCVDTDGRASYPRGTYVKTQEQPVYSITVRVLDISDNAPIQGANVEFSGGYTGVTDDVGRVSFALKGGIYDLSVIKPGYYVHTEEGKNIAGNQLITIKLTKQGAGLPPPSEGENQTETGTETEISGEYKLYVTVYDEITWDLISGASVTVGIQTAITDDTGIAEFTFDTSSDYDMTVTAEGYQSYSTVIDEATFLTTQAYAFLTPLDTGETHTPDDEDWNEWTDEWGDDGYTDGWDDYAGDGWGDGGFTDGGTPAGSTVNIEVYDADTFMPVSNALVSLGSEVLATDGTGLVTFKNMADKTYTVNIEAMGYEIYSDTLTVSGYTSKIYYLTSTGSTGTAEDPTDNTPADQKYTVTVTVTNGDDTTVIKIDNAIQFGSSATFKISEGTHTLIVGRGGYETYVSQIAIPDNTEFTVTLVKLSEGTSKSAKPGDIDGDGIPNNQDTDLDGDGIPNNVDPDIDGDGILNDEDEQPYIPSVQKATPGFELIGIFLAIIMTIIFLKRRKK